MVLPEELLTHVFGHFDQRDDQHSLLNLRLVSKTFRRLVDPLICIVLDGTPETKSDVDLSGYPNRLMAMRDPEVRGRLRPKFLQLKKWAEKVSQQPCLARMFVKEAKFGHMHPRREPDAYTPGSVMAMYEQLSTPIDMCAYLRQQVLSRLAEHHEKGHVAIILSLCHSLETLDFAFGFEASGRLLTRYFQFIAERHLAHYAGLSPAFPVMGSIKTVRIGVSTFNYCTGVSDALTMLTLPRLEELTIRGLADNRSHSNHDLPPLDGIVRNRNANLRLNFDSCMLSGEGLSHILAACTSIYSLTARWRGGLWTEHLQNPPLGDAIREHGWKIRRIHLDTTPCWIGVGRNHTPEEPFGSFADIHSKMLALPRSNFPVDGLWLPSHVIRGRHVAGQLPPSLEELYVLGADDAAGFDALLNHPDLPCLQKVVCVPWLRKSARQGWRGFGDTTCINYWKTTGLEIDSLASA
ncbi:hypothetical protein HII31_04853 [Pseudocercospora fuligena]|uniref:F-box domain-containing protein n=1 Tax=Pseudocercospora fuligena TaxID=685502 RepID=A0A8H6VMP6_9PEZI|nr:hypothetical protein HII31_04853 [Pseudocercospora fuligena]